MRSVDALQELYCQLMEEIKRRVDAIDAALNGFIPPIHQVLTYEFCYLQLRMICEIIALDCLVAHGDIPATRGRRLSEAYQADLIMRKLEHLHPDFYPLPSRQVERADGIYIDPIKSGYLTKTDLVTLYRETGQVLHRGNLKRILSRAPLKPNLQRAHSWRNKIVTLLTHHQIQLIFPDLELWVIMREEKDGHVRSSIMQKVRDDASWRVILRPICLDDFMQIRRSSTDEPFFFFRTITC